MLRRNLFRWLFTTAIPFLIPRFSRAQAGGLSDRETPLLLEVAAAVLPSSLGKARTDEVGKQFLSWTRQYKAGADAGYGYGFTKVEVLPANPASNYPGQLRALQAAATEKGGTFASLDGGARREIIADALQEAKLDRIPQRPNGQHIAADLLAFFYNSANGQDFLYGVAIKRDDCRGLASSAQRPPSLS